MAPTSSFHQVRWSVLIVFAALVVCGMASWVLIPNTADASIVAHANPLASPSASTSTPSVTATRTLTATYTATVAHVAATATSTRTPPRHTL